MSEIPNTKYEILINMRMHKLQRPKTQRHARRVGRGGKRGTYSGRGMKGQKSRAGAKIRPEFREFFKRVPKLRGATNGPTSAMRKTNVATVSLGAIDKRFVKDETVSPQILVERKLIAKFSGRLPLVKILAQGTISKSVNVAGCSISASARQQIEKAGGSVK